VQVRRGLLRTRRWSLRYDTRALLVCVLLGVLAACAMVLAIGTGTYELSPPEVLSTLAGDGPPGAGFVVLDLRLPRALVAALVGFGLGMAGAVFQSLTRNPLGSPDVIGFGNGASAGALVAIIVLDAGTAQTAVGAVCGGVATAAAVYLLAWKRGVHGYRLVLVPAPPAPARRPASCTCAPTSARPRRPRHGPSARSTPGTGATSASPRWGWWCWYRSSWCTGGG
jgi:iron complex transport system permease protein